VIEPGWISLRARGPARYFGGDLALSERLSERLAEAFAAGDTPATGVASVIGIGVADGRFASSVAARLAVRRRNRDSRLRGRR
jgi:protein ImuB